MKSKIGLLAALLLVGLWASGPALADGLYAEGGISAIAHRGGLQTQDVYILVPHQYADGSTRYDATLVSLPTYWLYDINRVRNPYGALAVGYNWRWDRIDIDIEVRHQSSIAAADHGEDSIGLKLRWYPFGER
jgi:hypothetical protein